MHAGEIYSSNFWGDMEILEYVSSKEVIVKFINSGNIQTAQRYAILDGLVKDQKAEKGAADKRDEAIESEKVERSLKEKHDRELRRQLKRQVVDAAIASRRRWYAMMRDLKCNVDSTGKLMCGEKFADRNGQVFQVRSKKSFDSLSWFIVYESSGNGYWVSESSILAAAVYDKNSPEAVADERLRRKKLNAEKYEANRAHYIAKADAYQRNNVERTRVRNRNRRAIREGAEGKHTLEQVMKLLQDQHCRCACCGVQLAENTRELDHKMPLVLGGSNWIENLQWLCQFCNGSKNGSHPDEWEAYTSSDSFKKRRLGRLVNDSDDWLSSLGTMPLIHEYFKRFEDDWSDLTQTEPTTSHPAQS